MHSRYCLMLLAQAGQVGQARQGQRMMGNACAMCYDCESLYMKGIFFGKWKAIATVDIIWTHLEYGHLVIEQTLLDVDLAETLKVYNVSPMLVQ